MENPYAKLLGLPEHIKTPNYYQLLGLSEGVWKEAQLEKAYKNRIQNLQKLGNNPKYKDTILFLKGELRNARTILADPVRKGEYDLVLLAQRIEEVENELKLFKVKGYLVQTEVFYLKKRATELKIPISRLDKILQQERIVSTILPGAFLSTQTEAKKTDEVRRNSPISKGEKSAPEVNQFLPISQKTCNKQRLMFNKLGKILGVLRVHSIYNHRGKILLFLEMITLTMALGIILGHWPSSRMSKNSNSQEQAREADSGYLSKASKPFSLHSTTARGQDSTVNLATTGIDRASTEEINSKLVYVRGGYFRMGNAQGSADERPVRKIYLDEYHISRYEVTNREYREFVKAVGHSVPYVGNLVEANDWNWNPLQRDYPKGLDNYPVVLVSWHDAVMYCHWLSGRIKRKISLPTEAQWEKAARGTDSLLYPWGDHLPQRNKSELGNFKGSQDGFAQLAPVGNFPWGISPYGCWDMAGNVTEWCLDSYDKFFYQDMPERNPYFQHDDMKWSWKVLRGGSWDDSLDIGRSSYRFSAYADERNIRWGFRYVMLSEK